MKMNRVPFGKYEDKLWKDVPKSYLEFVGNGSGGELSRLCRDEIENRKIHVRDVFISNSAIDSASFSCIEMWQKAIMDGETQKGFYTYLQAITKHAISMQLPDENGNIHFNGLVFFIDWGKVFPTLKQVRAIK